ncbi:serine family amino acid catabolism-related protein [Zymoseptoria brevis]|uniref:L-serine ammonia-lyase n=1 Tax=Zymoseptoria brevis TaxID=1047168 RepID=A0A0F4GXT7_9PEZI|nr:serine family amino acid catabolism-related protein [Zymoseptoria brevis]
MGAQILQQDTLWVQTTPSLEVELMSKAAGWTPEEKTPWRQTPLVESAALSQSAGCRVFLKLETLQPSGSFKSRGLGNLVLRSMARATNPDKVHFYSSSGGNAGLGCVHAANFVGRPATVAVPMTTKPHMIAKIKAAGAQSVIQKGANLMEASEYMREVVMVEAESRGEEPVGVSPFDHPDIWAGHETLVEEMSGQFAAMGEEGGPDVVVCSVGGGGLFNGIMQGMEKQGEAWEKTQVVAVETAGADSLAYSLEQGEICTLQRITSIATSLGVSRISERTWELAQEGRRTGKVKNAVLSDAEAAMGCWRLADDEKILVEAACGVSAALCYGGRLKRALGRAVKAEEKVVIVVCGGSNVSTRIVEGWRDEFLGALASGGQEWAV